jgi:hypothetical protein
VGVFGTTESGSGDAMNSQFRDARSAFEGEVLSVQNPTC